MKNKFIPILVLALLIIAGILFWQRQHAGGVQVQDDFGDKVVYTVGASEDQTLFKQDCADRGGEFNTCGSPCASNADFCIKVCAFTCDNIK